MESKSTEDQLVLYESKDLLTHAVCVGMTGSGKTGLCMVLLEEAIIDGIPLIIVNPKGDISNLLLTFPQLNAENFLPWINEQDAIKKGLSFRGICEKSSRNMEERNIGLESTGRTNRDYSAIQQILSYTHLAAIVESQSLS